MGAQGATYISACPHCPGSAGYTDRAGWADCPVEVALEYHYGTPGHGAGYFCHNYYDCGHGGQANSKQRAS